MSVATEFAFTAYRPEPVHPHRRTDPPARRPAPSARVITLYRPSARTIAAPVRLTRRGVLVLAGAVAVLGAVLVTVTWLSAPTVASAPDRPGGSVGVSRAGALTVRPGDTLWRIATVVAPQRDPRAEVSVLQRLNHLSGAELMPGQVLRTR